MIIPQAVTQTPGFHWFGYYDKFQFDESDRFLLGMRTTFEHRLPAESDFIELGYIDLMNHCDWHRLGTSSAWCWQQGCMLQWLPGTSDEVIWNDRVDGRLISRVCNVRLGFHRVLESPIGAVHPTGRTAVAEDFSRVWDFRPGYSYPGLQSMHADKSSPEDSGITLVDILTGQSQQIISVAEIASIAYENQSDQDRHYLNNLSWSPSGERFLFLHRWVNQRQHARIFTADADGTRIRQLCAEGASHWCWRDNEHVLVWTDGAYRLFRDDGSLLPISTEWDHHNGHHSYLPNSNNEWLLTDTYVNQASARQAIFLFNLKKRIPFRLGEFESPKAYVGPSRCDLHPRSNRKGTHICFDSVHENGRQLYIMDIRSITCGT